MKIIERVYKGLHLREYKSDETSEGVIIAVHGFAGDKESSVICALANEMCNHKYDLVSFDLPNHGANDSDLPLNLTDCFNAIKEIDLLVKNEYMNHKISYFATSFGGYLLLNLLNNDHYKYHKIILRAPAVDMGVILSEVIINEHGYSLEKLKHNNLNFGYEKPLIVNYDFYRDLMKNDLRTNYKNTNFLHVIQGKKDDVVSYKNNEKFFSSKCNNQYQIYYFENADHRFKKPGELEQIIEISKQILLDK